MPSPQRASNTDFSAGGIYPGGTGIIRDIGYRLWDYGGKRPPNSEMCVECVFAPIDGSNEGAEIEINWNVGPASSFTPDEGSIPTNGKLAGFCLDLRGGHKLSDNSNWAFAYTEGFIKNCGLPAKQLDGPQGLKCLVGSELTLVRMDPPKRSFTSGPGSGPADQQSGRVNQILVPTKAKWAWERGGAAARASAATATATAASASTNGSAPSPSALSSFMSQILSAESDGFIEMKDFTSKLTAALTLAGLKGKERVAIMKQSKDPALMSSTAQSLGYILEDFSVDAEGAMKGTLSKE